MSTVVRPTPVGPPSRRRHRRPRQAVWADLDHLRFTATASGVADLRRPRLPVSSGTVAGGRGRRIPHQQLLGPVGHCCEGPALRVVRDRRGRPVSGPTPLLVQPPGPRPPPPADPPL